MQYFHGLHTSFVMSLQLRDCSELSSVPDTSSGHDHGSLGWEREDGSAVEEGSLSSGLNNTEDYHLFGVMGAVSIHLTMQKQLNSQIGAALF